MTIVNSEQLIHYIDLAHLSVTLLVLVFLLISVRLIQPRYARHPVIYSYFPLIIIPFYAYFIDSEILEFITNLSIQATALIIFTGLVVMYSRAVKKGYLLYLAILFYIVAFTLYWYPEFDSIIIQPMVHLFIAAGMIITSFKFPSILIEHKR
ncbi:hypothetical protein [Rhodohalobacter sp. 8-1]|uniref:hypothetical protein n=1 Tax=Rhodohalobacter sp. 8-1 TaxID=3131972 RepID=UPI0030ECCF26